MTAVRDRIGDDLLFDQSRLRIANQPCNSKPVPALPSGDPSPRCWAIDAIDWPRRDEPKILKILLERQVPFGLANRFLVGWPD